MKKTYKCYSPRLKRFLSDNNVRYEFKFINAETNKICWVYSKDKKLDELLTEWSSGSK